MFHEWLEDPTPLPSADHVWQIGHVKMCELEQYYEMYRHLQDQKKDQQLEDSRKGQGLEDLRKDHELKDSRKDQELEDLRKDQELDDSRKDQELEDSKRLLKLLYHTSLDDSKNECDLDDLLEESESLLLHGMMFNPVKKSLFKNELLPKRIECTDSTIRELQALLDFTVNG